MKVVRFAVCRAIQSDEWVVVPHIDGSDLRTLLHDVELPFATREGHPEIAGEYDGVPLEFVRPPSRYLLGDEPSPLIDECKTAVLECKCGCEGCWPFLVRITLDGDTVVWSDFEQPHRGPHAPQGQWTYEALPPFRFSLQQYEGALADLAGPPSGGV